jgi:hypothetical protein
LQGTDRAIDREPRGTSVYEEKLAARPPEQRLILELVEESILADRGRTHSRRTQPDGTTFDLTAYDEFDVLVTFRERPGGSLQFIDFRLYDRRST